MNRVFNMRPRSVSFNIKKGCYYFEQESAIGKTYLGEILKKLNAAGELSACVITYDKELTSMDIINSMSKKDYDIIFLDRLDMYISKEISDYLFQNGDKTTYFLDLKDLNKLGGLFPGCIEIIWKKDRIEVSV